MEGSQPPLWEWCADAQTKKTCLGVYPEYPIVMSTTDAP